MSADERLLSESVDGVEVDVVIPPDTAPLARQTLAYGLELPIVGIGRLVTAHPRPRSTDLVRPMSDQCCPALPDSTGNGRMKPQCQQPVC